MPQFNITTIEQWGHRVNYHGVEAESLEEAMQEIRDGHVMFGDQECLGEGDEVLYMASAEDAESGEQLVVPTDLEEPSEPSELSQALARVDWELLARQKEWLAQFAAELYRSQDGSDEHAQGILNLLDALQDEHEGKALTAAPSNHF